MSTEPELSVLYHNQQQYYSTPILIAQHQQYRIHSSHSNQPPMPVQKTNQRYNGDQNDLLVSPPLSVASSSSLSSTNSYHYLHNANPLLLPTQLPKANTTFTCTSTQGQGRQSSSAWNFTWLVFKNEKWVPFEIMNQTKLEQTLTVGGTFVDITDRHFPDVKRVRVFPRNNYLSYLGVKYRLSRIMQPDAYLDHVAVAEAKQPNSPSFKDNRNTRAWEI